MTFVLSRIKLIKRHGVYDWWHDINGGRMSRRSIFVPDVETCSPGKSRCATENEICHDVVRSDSCKCHDVIDLTPVNVTTNILLMESSAKGRTIAIVACQIFWGGGTRHALSWNPEYAPSAFNVVNVRNFQGSPNFMVLLIFVYIRIVVNFRIFRDLWIFMDLRIFIDLQIFRALDSSWISESSEISRSSEDLQIFGDLQIFVDIQGSPDLYGSPDLHGYPDLRGYPNLQRFPDLQRSSDLCRSPWITDSS